MWLMARFLTWWLRGPRYRWSRLRRRLFEGRYLKTKLPDEKSLKTIQLHLQRVKWSGDGFFHLYDSISYPQRVWAKKRDDCDGFAILAAELLQRWDPTTNPVLVTAMVKPVKSCHTICIFQDGPKLAYFSNSNLHRGNFRKYEDVVADFTQKYEYVICWDVVRPDTFGQIYFHPPRKKKR